MHTEHAPHNKASPCTKEAGASSTRLKTGPRDTGAGACCTGLAGCSNHCPQSRGQHTPATQLHIGCCRDLLLLTRTVLEEAVDKKGLASPCTVAPLQPRLCLLKSDHMTLLGLAGPAAGPHAATAYYETGSQMVPQCPLPNLVADGGGGGCSSSRCRCMSELLHARMDHVPGAD
jgi:hypothetical protein